MQKLILQPVFVTAKCMSAQRLEYLFLKYYDQSATPEERQEFLGLVSSGVHEEQLKRLIFERFKFEANPPVLDEEQSGRILGEILHPLSETGSGADTDVGYRRYGGRFWFRVATVAAAVAAICYFGYRELAARRPGDMDPSFSVQLPGDVAPGGERASLALADGTVLNLEASASENALHLRGISNDRERGELSYPREAGEHGMNTLSTPLGGQYRIVLPDGSKAWLNAGSSLTYPTSFASRNRGVEMTGEVYFEIAPDKLRPFYVKVRSGRRKDTEIRVLGTHFNVQSYTNEPEIRTTLLEGAVQVKSGQDVQELTPGQQARIESMEAGGASSGIKVRSVDVSTAIAWKEGRFEFDGSIRDMMRQIARWYNVEIVYEGNVDNKAFAGTISRKKNVSEVLKMLELTGGIRFLVEGNKIIVKPF